MYFFGHERLLWLACCQSWIGSWPLTWCSHSQWMRHLTTCCSFLQHLKFGVHSTSFCWVSSFAPVAGLFCCLLSCFLLVFSDSDLSDFICCCCLSSQRLSSLHLPHFHFSSNFSCGDPSLFPCSLSGCVPSTLSPTESNMPVKVDANNTDVVLPVLHHCCYALNICLVWFMVPNTSCIA